jgi:hypothetical protein
VRALLRAGGVGGLGGAVMASSRQRSASGPRCASQAIAERDDKEANNRGGDVRALLRAGGLGGTVLVSSRQRSASDPRCAPRGSVTSAPRGSVTNSVRPSASMPVAAGRAGEEGAKCCSCCRAVVIEWVRVVVGFVVGERVHEDEGNYPPKVSFRSAASMLRKHRKPTERERVSF